MHPEAESRRSAPQDGLLAEVVIVGAGLAGLSCAGALREQGVAARVLEKSRGVGGRCATRRVKGRPVDHGLAFYHGDDPDFLSALHSVEPESRLVWPQRVVGQGAPCQPRAFRADQQRVAYSHGVSTFPKRLARRVAVDLETRATRIELDGDRLAVATGSGGRYRARSVVLALPAPQSASLLRTFEVPSSRDVAAATELLAGISLVRCLTLMAGYQRGASLPEWDVCYPQESEILQMVIHDSTKRPAPAPPVLVFQCRPRWSAEHWDGPPDAWTRDLLAAASTLCGDAVTRPIWTDTQRWRHARLTGGDSLTAPLLLRLENGCALGIAGEAMCAGGGAQAAWQSGQRMARRLTEQGDR